jgi:hypothetical protein
MREMDQRHVTPPSAEAESARDRFSCPSCGSSLRQGAVVCPYCDVDFRKPALDPPEAPSTQASLPIWGPPRPDRTPADSRLAWLSLIIAMSAPVAGLLVVPIFARLAPQLLMLAWMLSLGAILLSACAIHLARQAVRRIDNTQDKRGLMVAQWGLILGWGYIGFQVLTTVLGIFLQPFNSVIENLQP